jgi:hypothetical protein
MLVTLGACSVESAVTRAVGARCDTKAECDERCLPPGDEFPGGFCTLTCLRQGECPDGAACVDREGGICLHECEEPADCELLGPGWQCSLVGAVPEQEVRVCIGEG